MRGHTGGVSDKVRLEPRFSVSTPNAFSQSAYAASQKRRQIENREKEASRNEWDVNDLEIRKDWEEKQ